jgi:eukaryotic-like serine/threonine-protein kinase
MSTSKIQRIKRIGAGGFSAVYEVIIPEYGRVAVKELVSQNHEDVTRFRREVQIQSQLDHPNIVPILMSELDTNPPWFAMPLASSNLERELSRLTQDRPLLISVFRQILDGMVYAHGEQVIHRDLKPENILWYEGDVVRITDFGLGKLLDPMQTMLTQTGQAFGSLAYVAPEQLQDTKSADARADIYGLGKLFYKALTNDDSPLMDIDPEKVEPKYRDFILKCTAWIPEDRFQTMAEVRREFEKIG